MSCSVDTYLYFDGCERKKVCARVPLSIVSGCVRERVLKCLLKEGNRERTSVRIVCACVFVCVRVCVSQSLVYVDMCARERENVRQQEAHKKVAHARGRDSERERERKRERARASERARAKVRERQRDRESERERGREGEKERREPASNCANEIQKDRERGRENDKERNAVADNAAVGTLPSPKV